MKKVSIVIVNYNTGKILAECLKSIYDNENHESVEIIIVDNSSTDDSVRVIRESEKLYKGIRVILLSERISFSAANNKGIEASTGDYLLILNPDIIFTMPVLEKLAQYLETGKVGAVTPMLLGNNGKFQYGYFQKYPTLARFLLFDSVLAKLFLGKRNLEIKYLHSGNSISMDCEVNFVPQIPCAFFMVKTDDLKKIGLMDESFKLFFEDVDLSYRMNKISRLGVVSDLSVKHLGGESFKTPDNWWMHGRFIVSMITFMRKHYGNFHACTLSVLAKINSGIILLIEKLKGNKADIYRIKKHRLLLKLLKEEKP